MCASRSHFSAPASYKIPNVSEKVNFVTPPGKTYFRAFKDFVKQNSEENKHRLALSIISFMLGNKRDHLNDDFV